MDTDPGDSGVSKDQKICEEFRTTNCQVDHLPIKESKTIIDQNQIREKESSISCWWICYHQKLFLIGKLNCIAIFKLILMPSLGECPQWFETDFSHSSYTANILTIKDAISSPRSLYGQNICSVQWSQNQVGEYTPLPPDFTGSRSERIAEGEKKRHNVRTTTENCYMPVSRTYCLVYWSCPI